MNSLLPLQLLGHGLHLLTVLLVALLTVHEHHRPRRTRKNQLVEQRLQLNYHPLANFGLEQFELEEGCARANRLEVGQQLPHLPIL